mmetsp:Transcript_42348/g.133436  ORF Transcript_42348/g.133436 Transcript_42348/m.133436 type:complete len:95 (-) Transcript_42348:54-338(-)
MFYDKNIGMSVSSCQKQMRHQCGRRKETPREESTLDELARSRSSSVEGDGAGDFRVVVGKLHRKMDVELGEFGNAGVAIELLHFFELGEQRREH